MADLKTQVCKLISNSIEGVFLQKDLLVELSYCDPQFGQFSTNFAMINAKRLSDSPMTTANKLVEILNKLPEITQAKVKEPGFVNIVLSDNILANHLTEISEDAESYAGKSDKPQKIVIDYSHPNIGKPMGVHHLLSTVIGDSIKLTYRQLGNEVIADNFVGDMGTQFGRLIHAVKTWGDLKKIEQNPVTELQKLYVKFHIQADSDDALDEAGRLEYKKLEQGDIENRQLLVKIQNWSKADMQQIYDFLKIDFDCMNGESFYEDKLGSVVALGKKKGIFQKSQGALVYQPKNDKDPPALVQKKDGTSLYLTRDLARIQYWQKTWNPDLMVVVVDMAQSLQLKQLFEVAEALDLTDAQNIHVGFGRMSFKDGSMSTRKGNIVLIADLIEQTKQRVVNMLKERKTEFSDRQKQELVDKITRNCLKYNILRQNRLSNIVFDWDTMLSLEGNSAPYLSYTMSRMYSIQSTIDASRASFSRVETKLSNDEKLLLLELTRVSEVLRIAARDFQPSLVATYCYGVAQLYNRFYQQHKVIEKNNLYLTRDKLNSASFKVMCLCFSILGLDLVTKM